MKRYQVITLCSAIGIGSFALGMAFDPVQIVESPIDTNSKQYIRYEQTEISEKEEQRLDQILQSHSEYISDRLKFQEEEYTLKDSGIIDTIIMANKMMLQNDREMINIDCRIYKASIKDRFQVNPDMIKFDSNTNKVATVIDICKSVGVKL